MEAAEKAHAKAEREIDRAKARNARNATEATFQATLVNDRVIDRIAARTRWAEAKRAYEAALAESK